MGEGEDALTKDAPQHKHGGITDQHPGHTDQKHLVHISKAKAGDDTAGNQGDIFGDGNAKTADQKNEKNSHVAVVSKKCNQDVHRLPVYLKIARTKKAIPLGWGAKKFRSSDG